MTVRGAKDLFGRNRYHGMKRPLGLTAVKSSTFTEICKRKPPHPPPDKWAVKRGVNKAQVTRDKWDYWLPSDSNLYRIDHHWTCPQKLIKTFDSDQIQFFQIQNI
jgi:hypothetical protein